MGIKTIGIKAPHAWLGSAFQKAKRSLMLAQESGKTGNLLSEINKDMEEVGFV